MRYDIRLTIDYSYGTASDHVRNILRLLPANGPWQRIERRLLTITPAPDERHEGMDVFGNPTVLTVWHRPVAEIRFDARIRAERLAARVPGQSPQLDEVKRQIDGTRIGPRSPLHFCAPSPRIPPSEAIAGFARAAVAKAPDACAAVEALGLAIRDAMAFDKDATDVTTAPETAFAARRGVCQDFAQIMIAGLRSVGIPAGYVSGFLRTVPPPGQRRLEGVDAMHGWVAAWCGKGVDWVEYDPTNGQWAGADYVSVAWGRDYADAAPVRGALRTAGATRTGHTVDVAPLPAR